MFFHGLVNVGRGQWSSSNSRAQVSGSKVAGVTRCPQPSWRGQGPLGCLLLQLGGALLIPLPLPHIKVDPLYFFFIQAAAGAASYGWF